VRGAWRAHLEKVLRSLEGGPTVCDPLIQPKQGAAAGPQDSCSAVLVSGDEPQVPVPYKASCPVCRLFGNTATASRIYISDGRKDKGAAVRIDNVAISRQTGTAISPFSAVGLKGAEFVLTVRLRNFELWQVGLLGHLFDDLGQGRVPLGYGKNKGLGRVTAAAERIQVTFFGQDHGAEGELKGLAEVLGEEERKKYDLRERQAAPKVRFKPGESSLWRFTNEVAEIAGFWNAVKPCFTKAVWERFPKLAERRREDGHGQGQ